jgi:hypothetical protein
VMSNCNACDQQSQRQINVKECFASLAVNELSLFLIHALQGGKIRFANSAIRQGPCGDSCALSMTTERKVRGRKFVDCRILGGVGFVGKMAHCQAGARY